ncbi:MAG TPA: STAS domain-containing protein [Pseudogracilibacillus sp.]|nr:STAS domain-containing protein [Pseudogracilibacillus sp.]
MDFTDSQLWDESAVGAIIKVKQQLEAKNCKVQITGLNASSEKLFEQLS